MPIDYKKYPKNWKEIRERILKRADNRCEFCGVENYATGYRDEYGKFIHATEGRKLIKIVLTIAHLDHDECNRDVKDERLAALCQKCHINYDKEEKQRRREQKKSKKLI